jgi:hypothetical protein
VNPSQVKERIVNEHKWEQRARKIAKRARGMVVSGKGTIRQQNELREKARQAARVEARRVAYNAKSFGEVEA